MKQRLCKTWNPRRALCLLLALAMMVSGCVCYSGGLLALAETTEDKAEFGGIQAEFFVSPSGDDSNPGTYEQPFASLERARSAVAQINENMTGDIYVFVLPGTYYVTETVDFDTADSGTNGYQIV